MRRVLPRRQERIDVGEIKPAPLAGRVTLDEARMVLHEDGIVVAALEPPRQEMGEPVAARLQFAGGDPFARSRHDDRRLIGARLCVPPGYMRLLRFCRRAAVRRPLSRMRQDMGVVEEAALPAASAAAGPRGADRQAERRAFENSSSEAGYWGALAAFKGDPAADGGSSGRLAVSDRSPPQRERAPGPSQNAGHQQPPPLMACYRFFLLQTADRRHCRTG